MSKIFLVVFCLGIGLAASRPQHPSQTSPQLVPPPAGVLEFGVDANGCTVGPSGIVCPSGPVQFTHEARGIAKEVPPSPRANAHPQSHHSAVQSHHSGVFTGLVGPSGVIGPSGLVGPSGPLHFGK